MRLPTPFVPLWSAKVGLVTHNGAGLLGVLNVQKHLIDEFTVWAGGHSVTVWPKLGTIGRDGSVSLSVGKPMPLAWFRRMTMALGTADKNTAAAQCAWYGVGLETPNGVVGYRLRSDGTTSEGIA